jgi:hypothetical protein
MQTKTSTTLNLQYAALNNASALYSNFVHLIFLIILKLVLLKAQNLFGYFLRFVRIKTLKITMLFKKK